jgi:hypothetical protein
MDCCAIDQDVEDSYLLTTGISIGQPSESTNLADSCVEFGVEVKPGDVNSENDLRV